MRDDPQPLRSSPALERIVGRCLAKQPGQRFQTMGELRSALEVASAETAAAPPIAAVPSIAVLPFANMSANEEAGYFGDGLAEEVINLLAQMPGLKVAGRTSSFFFRGKDVEFAEIARRLNVEYLLEGSVRTAANRIRVTAQLIKVADGFHLWSERYDREMIDIFTIQDEITHAIGAALKLKLAPQPAPQRRHVPALRAYQAYLQAREHWFKPTPESLALVKNRLEAAIELDPAFALPYGLLGGHYTMLSGMGIRPAREVIPLAKAAEYNALRIDPSLPEAHALLGVCAGTFDFDWREAERHWRQAMAHGPESRDIRFWYGNHFLLPIGRTLEAVEAMEWGLQEDPLNLLYRHHLAVGFRHARQAGRRGRRTAQGSRDRRAVPAGTGNARRDLRTAESFRRSAGLDRTGAVRRCPGRSRLPASWRQLLARAGSTRRADALLETLMPGTACGAPTALAIYYAMGGDLDQAAHWAERAIDERFPPLVAMLGPLLRATPKWPALAAMMRLPG